MEKDGLILPISEHFYSLQGEGKNTGKASYFIRLAGCNVGCSWCDSKSSWEQPNYTELSINSILEYVLKAKANNVVITGGEPTLYNLQPLTELLKSKAINICLETSGTHYISGLFDWICVSPKPHKTPKQEVLKQADELKIIIFDDEDFQFAKHCAKQVKKDCLLFLQPEWGNRQQNITAIVEFIKENPKWLLSLQTHKFIDIP